LHYDRVVMPAWRLLVLLALFAPPALWGQCNVEQERNCEQTCSEATGHSFVACIAGCRAQCSKSKTAPLTTFTPVTISGGTAVTAADIAAFDTQWMQPAQLADELGGAQCTFFDRFPPETWTTEPEMTSLARMYEITHDHKYLDADQQFIELALQYRDDNYNPSAPYPCNFSSPYAPPHPIDAFRNRVMPAWGGLNPDHGCLNFVPEATSSLIGYAIATFARIVAEDPTLQPAYGNNAIRYANAALETAWAFMPQVTTNKVGSVSEAHLSQLDIYRTKPTQTQCDIPASKVPPNCFFTNLSQEETNCKNQRVVAGAPLADNESLDYAMMLIELWRALDSPFYQQSNQQAANAAASRTLFPVLVSRFYRYFVNRTHVVSDSLGDRFTWHYQDDQPSSIKLYPEDVSHGASDIRLVEVLRASFDRINAAATSGGEPIPMDLTQLDHFANTFLEEIAPGTNFNADVNGAAAKPDPKTGQYDDDGDCDGWVDLSVADPRVWGICHDITLRVLNESQPYLTMGNHSALLATKAFSASLLSATGKITFLRVNDVGTGFGTPIDFLDAEVIVQLDSQPGKSFGLQLRTGASVADHRGMLEVLRSAFRTNRTVSIDYTRNGADNGIIIRVAKVN